LAAEYRIKLEPTLHLINADHLVKRHALQQLAADLRRADADCALITETWFTKRHLDQQVSIEGFKLFRRDRQIREGGGVCIYVRSNIE